MNLICVFGNSIAWDAWDIEKGGWPPGHRHAGQFGTINAID